MLWIDKNKANPSLSAPTQRQFFQPCRIFFQRTNLLTCMGQLYKKKVVKEMWGDPGKYMNCITYGPFRSLLPQGPGCARLQGYPHWAWAPRISCGMPGRKPRCTAREKLQRQRAWGTVWWYCISCTTLQAGAHHWKAVAVSASHPLIVNLWSKLWLSDMAIP